MANGNFLSWKFGLEHRAGRTWNMAQPNPKVSFDKFQTIQILEDRLTLVSRYLYSGVKEPQTRWSFFEVMILIGGRTHSNQM